MLGITYFFLKLFLPSLTQYQHLLCLSFYYTLLLTIVTMLYIRSPELIHLLPLLCRNILV